ncbi:MAG: hypothetical protein GC178_16410 [Flavobacteriales bacterium]|nr:hypothetical protein [Flavobacteriales bacterium]
MKYSAKALLVYLLAMAITFLLNEFSSVEFNAVHISFWGLFMYGSTLMVHHFTIKAAAENPKRFPASFMGITGLKMLAYLIALGIYVYIFQDAATPVVIAFLGFYVVYTVLEVISATAYLKSKD